MAWYSFDISQPMKCLPVCNAATAVVPLPMNGSRTTPPSGAISMSEVIRPRGFCVECTRASPDGAANS